MKKKLHLKNVLAFLGVATFFCIGPPANSQTQDDNPPPRANDSRSNDITRPELRSFDQFLDSHREIAEQLQKDPSLVKNTQFVQNHPALQTYLQQHPEVRAELAENPSVFMHREDRYDRSEDARDRDMNRTDYDRRDLDARRDNDNRPGQAATTAGTAAANRGSTAGTRSPTNAGGSNSTTTTAQNSNGSSNQAAGSQQAAEQRRGDQAYRERADLASFDEFLNGHREISEELRRNPSLADNQQSLKDHPALESYLQHYPGVRAQLTDNPQAFMQSEDRFREQVRDMNQNELARFDQFLDGHRNIAEELRRNPSLADNQQYVQSHPELQSFLQENPGIRQQLQQNPNDFMQREGRYDTREDARNMNQGELARFNQFLDGHREIGDQLRRNPSLADNQQFVQSHPALQSFLQENPGVRQQLQQDPNAFMQREDRYDTREDARNGQRQGLSREDLASFDRFLDNHREEAEQLRRDPSLASNRQFVQSHPALQAYLQDHQGVREQLQQNPNGFMRGEQGYERTEDAGHMQQAANFREFLGGHSGIAQDLSQNPTKANDAEYQHSHPELQTYLSAHPDVQSALRQNPQSFMKTVQQPAAPATTPAGTTGTTTTGTPGSTKTPPVPKPPMR